ncbi:hypothetical protein [Pseudoalteromonas maricaloris]|uniref:hypothetical protein n=1 Tax=Pseudoalteromonas maricaloris TaxID=184924 RepID=UPI003C1D31F4
MTIESQLAQLQQAATEQTEASVQLANNITEGLQEIDQVKQDIAHTYQTVNQNNQALNDWQTQSGSVNLKDLNGNSHTLPTLKSLIADAQSVNPHPHVMTKAQFDALRDMRKQQYAGSGFVEWGLGDSAENAVNNGMWVYQNKLNLGRSGKTRGWFGSDKSSTPFPKGLVDGVSIDLQSVDYPYGIVSCKFPPAPDGTKTYDSASGTVTQHNDAEAAFAAETDSNKVITSRKDLVFLESWHEKIADKDVVYPLGNVQYGANNYKGITLRNNLVAQGYSAFGEWDTGTKGHGIKWSSLTEAQKAIFLGEPEHNIYYDPKAKAYIQVRYRVRVIEGLGDNWDNPYIHAYNRGIDNNYISYTHGLSSLKPRGKRIEGEDLGPSNISGEMSYAGMLNSNAVSLNAPIIGGMRMARHTSGYPNNSSDFGYEGKCYGIPIALVQRLNKGAYHPSYNPMGTTQYTMTGVRNYHWYELPTSLRMSTLGCFIQPTETSIGKHPGMGYIGSHGHSRADQYKYHDAIYAGQVEDLRLNANKVDVNLLRENVMRQAVAGTLRGKEKTPFTYFEHRYGVELARSATYNQINAGGSIEFKISAGQPVLDAYLSDPNNIGYYVYNQKGDSIYISKLVASPINYVNWPYSGNDKVTCYIYGVENKVEEFNSTFSIGDTLFIGALRQLSCEFDTLPSVDIIGSPENIAATFPDGVVGQWTPKLPTGVIERFAANRKATGGQYGIFTLDNGASWRTTTSTFNNVSNDFTNDCEANRVQLMYYESSSKFTEQVQNSHILGLLDKSYFSADYALSRGNRLMGSLIDKTGKSEQNSKRYGYVTTESLAINHDGLLISNEYSPTHKNLNIGSPKNNSAAFKVMPSITSKNGLLYLQFHGAELKHNGTDWGDDQTIPIISGENTKTDLNGNTVKVFCHHTLFPIGIAHNG